MTVGTFFLKELGNLRFDIFALDKANNEYIEELFAHVPRRAIAEVGQDKWYKVILVVALRGPLLPFDCRKRARLRGQFL